jgi:UDP-4-amino-4,6-dideoxy-N-acetyl-beta-L-altrosamine N-acetyltransferase
MIDAMSLKFVLVTEADPAIQERLRELRNMETVRRYSYTDHIISREEHAEWLESLKGDVRRLSMAVLLGGETVGAVSLSNINERAKTADWSFYLGEDFQGKGLGSLVEYELLEFAFNERGLYKLNCEVLDTNPAVVTLHEKFGFVREGLRRQQAVKNGRRVDVHLLGLTKDRWSAIQPKMHSLILRIARQSRVRHPA